jgi:hypothetical protein
MTTLIQTRAAVRHTRPTRAPSSTPVRHFNEWHPVDPTLPRSGNPYVHPAMLSSDEWRIV